MIRRFVVFLLLCLVGQAHAQNLTKPQYSSSYGMGGKSYVGVQPYCDAYAAMYRSTCVNAVTSPIGTNQQQEKWTFQAKQSDGSLSGPITVTADYYCAAPSTYYTDSSGVSWCKGAATPDPCAGNDTKNPYIRSFSYSNAASGVLPTDDGTCKITNVTLLKCYTNAAGQKYCYFQYNQTTSKKDSTSPPLPAPAPSTTTSPTPAQPTDKAGPSPALPADLQGNCPSGTVQAGVDPSGIPKCIGTGTAPQNPDPAPPTTTKPPTTTSNPDGSSVTKQDVVQTNSDGSTTTTTTTTTKAADGTTSVSVSAVTSNTPTGGAGRQDTPNADQQNLCKQNPMLTVCQNSSVTGTCGEISCTGDAIQCATLRAAAQMQCQQKQDKEAVEASGAYALGKAVVEGADPMAGTLPKKENAAVVTVPSSLDQQGWLGASAGVDDVTFTLQGKTFTIPLAKTTGYLVGLRYAMMIIALLVSFRMLSGVIFKE